MKFVFDLDYTLLDTVKFKEALADAVTSCGVSRERYEETYQAIVRREGKVYDYDPDVHLSALKDDLSDPAALADARRRIAGVLASTEKYLYPGAAELLRELRKHGARLELLTLGNEKWQRAKVEHSGLARLFDVIMATEKEKKGIMAGLAEPGERVMVVNDNGAEIKEMMAQAPEYEYVLKRGPKAVPAELQLPEAKDMKELAALISAETGWEIDLERRSETSAEAGSERSPRPAGGRRPASESAEQSVSFGPEKKI